MIEIKSLRDFEAARERKNNLNNKKENLMNFVYLTDSESNKLCAIALDVIDSFYPSEGGGTVIEMKKLRYGFKEVGITVSETVREVWEKIRAVAAGTGKYKFIVLTSKAVGDIYVLSLDQIEVVREIRDDETVIMTRQRKFGKELSVVVEESFETVLRRMEAAYKEV